MLQTTLKPENNSSRQKAAVDWQAVAGLPARWAIEESDATIHTSDTQKIDTTYRNIHTHIQPSHHSPKG
jgi:hypothetical protein